MIDAYEIGIQLLLQEDVSAGLEVINRGLTEVDRAIAATSAELVGLIREAETATKDIASAVRSRAIPAAAAEQDPNGTVERVVQGGLGDSVPTPPIISGEKSAAPATNTVKQPDVPASSMASPSGDEPALPQQASREQTISPVAPTHRPKAQDLMIGQQENKLNTEPQLQTAIAPVQTAPAASQSRELALPLVREVTTAKPGTRQSVTPSSPEMALTASVSRARKSDTPQTQPERVRQSSVIGPAPAPHREPPVAPWSGVDQAGPRAETMRLQARAAAPKSASQNQNEPGGGTVMLDGRLVGQWLSEHMAREASRPPAGTSFFDPRQTPSWTVSGAL